MDEKGDSVAFHYIVHVGSKNESSVEQKTQYNRKK